MWRDDVNTKAFDDMTMSGRLVLSRRQLRAATTAAASIASEIARAIGAREIR
jgi:hypothetical protein